MRILTALRNWIFITHHCSYAYNYEEIMKRTLIKRRPKTILEWGSGRSTMLMRKLCPNAEIHSIEDDLRWFLRWKIGIKNVNLHYIPLDRYSNPDFPNGYFDFIFIDGENEKRVDCMKSSLKLLKDGGLLMMHDSEVEEYRRWFNLFDFIEENNHTVLLKKT